MAKAKTKTAYFCTQCGYESIKWAGRCPGCGEWNSFVEELKPSKSEARTLSSASAVNSGRLERIKDVKETNYERIQTSMNELNQLLGGGFVKDSFTLIAGEPGVGKSTLFMQIANDLSVRGYSVLYASGEESNTQLKNRALRLGAGESNVLLLNETNLGVITKHIESLQPDFLIIDSIQTLYHPENTSAPGSVSQVRDCAAGLVHIAKGMGVATLAVAQVLKDSTQLAGPKTLEHACDSVLYFEGDQHGLYRILSSRKNRFAELGICVMKMSGSGLEEVVNPSEIFLEDRSANNPGTAVLATLEGIRPIMVEIQALLTPTTFGNPRRMSSGIENSRLPLIIAVLEKHAGAKLQMQDAYVKVTGGLRLEEPAADLALAMAIISSDRSQALGSGDIVMGEVGLTGEIRRISRLDERLKEARKLGFTRAIVPKKSIPGAQLPEGLEVVGVDTISEAIQKCFPSRQLPF